MNKIIQVNKVKCIGDLLAPLKSLINVGFMLLKILEYALVTGIPKANPSLKWVKFQSNEEGLHVHLAV